MLNVTCDTVRALQPLQLQVPQRTKYDHCLEQILTNDTRHLALILLWMHVCFCCIYFHFSVKPRDWLERTFKNDLL